MTFEELKEINYGTPCRALLCKALMESEGIVAFYKEQFKIDGKPYWKGKIGYQKKQIKAILNRLDLIQIKK